MLGSAISTRARTSLASSKYPCRYAVQRRIISRRKSTLPPSDTSPIPVLRSTTTHRRLFAFLGIGLTTAFAVHSFSSYTIHGDAKRNPPESEQNGGGKPQIFNPYSFETVVEADADSHIESNPSPGIWRRDSFQLGCNFPIEDVITTSEWDFSPTLTWTCITILDGHNGARLAEFLAQVLSIAVLGAISDVYSKHARSEDNASGFDLSGGREVQFTVDKDRNPGEPPDPYPPGEELDAAIRQAFLALDEFIVHESARTALGLTKEEYAALRAGGEWDSSKDGERPKMSRAKAYEALSYPYAGSCAIMGLFNPQDRSLRVALTGDLRAVYGRRIPNPESSSSPSTSNQPRKYTYQAHPLTQDQNATNPSEASLLTAAHPNEPALLKNNRVVGWGPSRAFGDGSMKWPLPVQHQLRERYFGERVREEVKTPPYFTAEPVLSRWEGEGGVQKGDFVVFASDGLWESLESEEVVGLVGWWLEERGVKERVKEKSGTAAAAGGPVAKEILLPPVAQPAKHTFELNTTDDNDMPTPVKLHISRKPSSSSSSKTYSPSDLPVLYPENYKDTTSQYPLWRAEKKFVCEDANIAAHLVRNAFGGADRDLRDALTGMDIGRCRRFRDDISVVVVFFD